MVPAKLVHDWKTLLISGQPLYPEDRKDGDSISRQSQSTCSVPPSDVVRDTLLDETNFWQYRVCNDCYIHLTGCIYTFTECSSRLGSR